jgi:hypothetical protein
MAEGSLTVWFMIESEKVAQASWLAYDRRRPFGELQAEVEALCESATDPSERERIGAHLAVLEQRGVASSPFPPVKERHASAPLLSRVASWSRRRCLSRPVGDGDVAPTDGSANVVEPAATASGGVEGQPGDEPEWRQHFYMWGSVEVRVEVSGATPMPSLWFEQRMWR